MCRLGETRSKIHHGEEQSNGELEGTTGIDSILIAMMTSQRDGQICAMVKINSGWKVEMQVDSGAGVLVLLNKEYCQWPDGERPQLEVTATKLLTYTGEQIDVLRKIPVTVRKLDQGHTCTGVIIVVKAEGRVFWAKLL